MAVETLALKGLDWLWSKYGKQIADGSMEKAKGAWTKFQWSEAERRYREKIFEQVSTTLLLGYSKPIKIDRIYTDVHVLDQISAKRRFNFEDLEQRPHDFDGDILAKRRRKAEDILDSSKRIFILGKPGAGKTTFLKYLAMLACNGRIQKTPIYLSLKEWSDSGLDLKSFIEKQFGICGFPESKPFVEKVLANGEAIVLLDGLDEVNQEGAVRTRMVQALVDLANQYSDCTFCITCRVAANDYTFTQFTYVEIADFDVRQKEHFIAKWYEGESGRLTAFLKEWHKAENYGFREIAQTPLLLALLCLAYDETLHLPKRRVELYTEALDALLKKWDSSRGILRAESYRKISLGRKKQLLSRIAAKNFNKGVYLFRKQHLVSDIEDFLSQLPPDDKETEPDGENVLNAIESQHSILVERAHTIYSFSHLTFQEFFTARYIVDNQAKGTLEELVLNYMKATRWREVALMTASLLDDATTFLDTFLQMAWVIISKDPIVIDLVRMANEIGDGKSASPFAMQRQTAPAGKSVSFKMPGDSEQVVDACFALAAEFSFGTHDSNHPSYHRSHTLAAILKDPTKFPLYVQDSVANFLSDKKCTTKLVKYLRANQLIVECMRVSSIVNRERLADGILKPRAES
jgi:predicted NACHT family NTPase